MNAEWRSIPDYEGSYEVSTEGSVRSLDRMISGRWGERRISGKTLKPKITLNGGYTTWFSDKELELVKEKKVLKVGDRVRVVKFGKFTTPHPDGDGWVGKEGTLAKGSNTYPWRVNRDDEAWTFVYDHEVELIEPEPTLAEQLEEAKTLVKVLEAQVESEGIAKYADAELGTIVTKDSYDIEERFVKIAPNSWVYINVAERGGTTRVYPDTYLAEYGQQEIPF